MKRKISDLLNSYSETELCPEERTPLSAERIRRRTMDAAGAKQERGGGGRRLLLRCLIAAAAVSLLAVTAYAAENLRTSEWFRGILSNRQAEQQQLVSEESEYYEGYTVQETVSQAQLELVDQLGEGFRPQTVQSNGTTMTLTAGYGDESVLHLYLQVTAPEGTVLPDDILYAICTHADMGDESYSLITVGENAPYDYVSGFDVKIEALEDDDPTDNQKDFHLMLRCQSAYELSALAADSVETLAKLNDGVEKYLNLRGLYRQIVDQNGDEDGYEPLLSGEFSFDITYSSEPMKYVLDVSNMTYGGHKLRRFTHPENPEQHYDWCPPYDENNVHTEEWDYTVTPTYFAITPMSVYWACESTCSDWRMPYDQVEFRVVMKDGTSPLFTYEMSGTCLFYNPIDLSQVDYILIGDEELGSTYKLYLPQG